MMEVGEGRGTAIEAAGGFGGLSLGAEMAGIDVRASIEINARHAETHKHNLPYCATLCGDMKEATGDTIRKQSGLEKTEITAYTYSYPALAVMGGMPCQGFSNQGKRDPEDPRNYLVHHWARLVGELAPGYACLEQVPGFLEPRNDRIREGLMEMLVKANYNVVEDLQTLDARDFGVPESRERVFLLAHRRGTTAPAYPTPTHTRNLECKDIFLQSTPTIRDAFFGLPMADDYDELWDQHFVRVPCDDIVVGGAYNAYLQGVSNDPTDFSYPRIWDRHLLTNSQLTRHAPASIERFRATAPGKSERVSRRHRLDPDGHSLTLRAGTGADKGNFTAVVPIHFMGHRCITVREGMRIHSVPDWVQLSPVKITAFQQLGNSVPPLLAKAVMSEIRKAAGLQVSKPTETINVKPLFNHDQADVLKLAA